MKRQITLPLESLVTFNKNGIVKIEHTKTISGEMNQDLAEALIRLLGSTPEKVLKGVAKAKEAQAQ